MGASNNQGPYSRPQKAQGHPTKSPPNLWQPPYRDIGVGWDPHSRASRPYNRNACKATKGMFARSEERKIPKQPGT